MTTSTSTYPQLPAGYEPVGTGYFEPSGTPVAMRGTVGQRELVAWDERGWLPVAPVILTDGRVYRVHCPTCPPPKLRKRKRPRPFHETVATHAHGHVGDAQVQCRTPHHAGPDYAILDLYGVFARTPTAVKR